MVYNKLFTTKPNLKKVQFYAKYSKTILNWVNHHGNIMNISLKLILFKSQFVLLKNFNFNHDSNASPYLISSNGQTRKLLKKK